MKMITRKYSLLFVVLICGCSGDESAVVESPAAVEPTPTGLVEQTPTVDATPSTEQTEETVVKRPARRHFDECRDKTKKDYLVLLEVKDLEGLSLSFGSGPPEDRGGDLKASHCDIIARIPGLKSLNISGSYVSRDCLIRLSACKSLRSLTLSGDQINDSTIALVIQLLPNLTELNPLSTDGTDGTDDACRWISRSKTIRRLHFGSSSRYIFDPGMKYLSSMKQLTHLSIQSKITDVGVKHLAALPHLKSLVLSGNPKITGSGFSHFQSSSELEFLSLMYCRVNNEALRSIGKINSLKRLGLSESEVTDQGLTYLQNLTNIESLSLLNCRINGSGFEKLFRLNRLSYLNLEGTYFDVDHAIYLSKLEGLRSLEIGHLKIPPGKKTGNRGIGTMHTLTQLESLTWDTYDESMLELKEQLPHVGMWNSELHFPQKPNSKP